MPPTEKLLIGGGTERARAQSDCANARTGTGRRRNLGAGSPFLDRQVFCSRRQTMSGVVKSFLGVSACAGTAALLSAFLRDYDGEMKLAVPVVCLMAVTATSVLVGRVPGFFGSLAATLFLTFFLFAPTGSLAVSDP